MKAEPIARDLVLVGGGHSHVIVLRMLAMKPVPGIQVTLVSPDVVTPYSGMLPGFVAGHYSYDDIHIDLVRLCRFAGARFIQARVNHVDPDAQQVECEGRPPLFYDVLSIDVGVTPELDSVSGAPDAVIPVKPISEFLDRWEVFLERAATGEEMEVGVVGAGAGGVELCLAIHYRLLTELAKRRLPNRVRFHLFSDGSGVLQEFDEAVQHRFLAWFEEREIQVWPQFRVSKISGKTLHSENGDQAALDEIFWVTSAMPQPWIKSTGLSVDDKGFLKLRDTLQTDNYPNVFGAGDTATVINYPRPRAGVFAVRQGPPLYRNILRYIAGQAPQSFKPQDEFLKLVSTGEKAALATRNGVHVAGRAIWYWKHWIDRRFMQRFSDLPAMRAEKTSGLLAEFDAQMHCGGCGSKVSADLLNQVLDELGIVANRDDAARYTPPAGQTMLHSVDGFRSFIDDPYVFARITVNHALSDIYAMAGKPVTALAMITLPYARPSVAKSLLKQLLQGTLDQLAEEGVELVGGHTNEGAELGLGFAVNGIVESDMIRGKRGMRPGDRLILTKPLGTGALFAADMQYRARGRWIQEALASMQQSNRPLLGALEVSTALTDVTGFGLAGHLQEMMLASDCGASIQLANLPVLEGALEVVHQHGITSTLHAGNRNAVTVQGNVLHEHYELVFDPQTAGGLLASVTADHAEDCIHALRAAGAASASIIGEVIAEPLLRAE